MKIISPPMLTDYHAKFLAHELSLRQPADSAERLATAVAAAQVDLNPHQVDAALFAFQSPLSKAANEIRNTRVRPAVSRGATC